MTVTQYLLKRIEELEKENSELKEHNKNLATSLANIIEKKWKEKQRPILKAIKKNEKERVEK